MYAVPTDTFWFPSNHSRVQPVAANSGVFPNSLAGSAHRATHTNVQKTGSVSWEHFKRVYLSQAVRMDLCVTSNNKFATLTTAADNGYLTRLLQWDSATMANPFAVYSYVSDPGPIGYGLGHGWNTVSAVVRRPNMWYGKEEQFAHHGKGVHFLLEGASDKQNPGLALFPETIRSELHEVRSVIEAASREGRLSGVDQASGVYFGSRPNQTPVRLRVYTQSGVLFEIELDRWD